MSIEPEPSPDLPVPTDPRASRVRIRPAFERKQTRELLEVHIGLPIIMEALEFALTDQIEQSDDGVDQLDVPPNKFAMMYELMCDPNTSPLAQISGNRPRLPIDSLMARCGVKLPEILALVGARNLGMALAKSGPRLGKVIDGIGEAAEPTNQMCERCQGEGYLAVAPDLTADAGEDAPDTPATICPKCSGLGTVRVKGDLDAAKVFIALHGGQTGGGGKGGAGDRNIINVVANATAKSESKRAGDSADAITTRVQKLIDV